MFLELSEEFVRIRDLAFASKLVVCLASSRKRILKYYLIDSKVNQIPGTSSEIRMDVKSSFFLTVLFTFPFVNELRIGLSLVTQVYIYKDLIYFNYLHSVSLRPYPDVTSGAAPSWKTSKRNPHFSKYYLDYIPSNSAYFQPTSQYSF